MLAEAGPTCEARRGRRWLGREDSNLRMAAPKAAALPLGDSPVRTTRNPKRIRGFVIPRRQSAGAPWDRGRLARASWQHPARQRGRDARGPRRESMSGAVTHPGNNCRLRFIRSVAPHAYLYSSAPRRKSKVVAPARMACSMAWATMIVPMESFSSSGS